MGRNKRLKKVLAILLYLLVCLAVGLVIGISAGVMLADYGFAFDAHTDSALFPVLLMLYIFLAAGVHIIVHESGHLVFGLLTGYGFVSFRIGKLMLVRKDGRLRLRRFSLPGTLGQCLLSPPESHDGRYPYLLYNLGGSLFNLTLSAVCLGLYLLLPPIFLLTPLLVMLICVGVFLALTNAVPIKTPMLTNDGANCVAIGRDETTRRAFFLQLRVNALLTQGQRLRDLPEEWFSLPEGADLKNVSLCSIGYLRACRSHDLHAFDEAQVLSERLLETAAGMNGIHKNELRCELLFYELIGDRRPEELERLDNAELRRYIRATCGFPARRRLLYARALLLDRDPAEASKQLQAFERTARSYPYAGELQGERELLELIRDQSDEQEKQADQT